MNRGQLIRTSIAVALVMALATTASAASGRALVNCPTYDPNVDCWSADEGWCPNHCKTACTPE